MNSKFWDERYAGQEYVYGELPNKYLALKLTGVTPGKILFPADGEGRNSVFAAQLGWDSFAFDQSTEGKRKAELLARRNGVTITYTVSTLEDISYPVHAFDAIALIFAHFAGDEKLSYLQQLATYLKPGGRLIFEAYSKNHVRFNRVDPKVGGPPDERMLYSADDLKNAFDGFEILELSEEELEIREGTLHCGISSVIRFLGTKK